MLHLTDIQVRTGNSNCKTQRSPMAWVGKGGETQNVWCSLKKYIYLAVLVAVWGISRCSLRILSCGMWGPVPWPGRGVYVPSYILLLLGCCSFFFLTDSILKIWNFIKEKRTNWKCPCTQHIDFSSYLSVRNWFRLSCVIVHQGTERWLLRYMMGAAQALFRLLLMQFWQEIKHFKFLMF